MNAPVSSEFLSQRAPSRWSSGGEKRAHRRPAGQSGHARGDRLLVDAPVSQGIPVRPAGRRDQSPAVVADPQSGDPVQAPADEAPRLRGDLEQGAQREPAEDHHARNRREARRRVGGGRARSRRALCRRLGDALRQAVDRRTPRGAAGRRLRPHPARAALSAILRRHQRDSLRQGVRHPQDDALAAGAAGSRRRTTTTPSISAPSRNRSARGSRRSISSRKSSSPRSTGYRAPISTRAIPIIAIAPRPGGCCARRSACRRNGSS